MDEDEDIEENEMLRRSTSEASSSTSGVPACDCKLVVAQTVPTAQLGHLAYSI